MPNFYEPRFYSTAELLLPRYLDSRIHPLKKFKFVSNLRIEFFLLAGSLAAMFCLRIKPADAMLQSQKAKSAHFNTPKLKFRELTLRDHFFNNPMWSSSTQPALIRALNPWLALLVRWPWYRIYTGLSETTTGQTVFCFLSAHFSILRSESRCAIPYFGR